MELVSIAPDRLVEVAAPCLPHLSSIVVNELEAGALTGIHAPVPGPDGPVDWEALAAMARGLVERGVGLAVVHFPAGSVAAAPDGRTAGRARCACRASEVRSTTGAGDAFAAGVIYGLHEGWPVERVPAPGRRVGRGLRAGPEHLRRHPGSR